MRQLYSALLFLLFFPFIGSTQNVGIGAMSFTPDPSSLLELRSTSKGLLIPRMTTSERVAISTPAEGLLVYQTDGTPGFYFYDGSIWSKIGGGSAADNMGNHTATQNLNLNGNWISNNGGSEGIRLLNNGKVGVGTDSPAEKLHVNGNARISDLGGNGDQMVICDNDGTLDTQDIPDAGLEAYNFGESSTTSTTNSTSWQTKETLNTGSVEAGDYHISWYAEWLTKDVAYLRVTLDGSEIGYMAVKPENNQSDFQSSFSGFDMATLSSGSHTIEIQYKADGGGNWTRIRNARIAIWKVD